MNVKSVLHLLFIICLVILMVSEACQESGTLYTGSTYNGYGDIYHKNLSGTPRVSLCDITPPWGGVLTDELLTEDVPKTYSSGTERYEITMHDAFIGTETTSAEFKECWWTEDGNRYVKTSGSNSTLGNSWTNAWLTMGYGFQNIPSGKDLYVEEGLYGGETLSNLNPPQTMKMYIQPSGHTEAACEVLLSDTAIINGGYACTTRPYTGSVSTNDTSVMQNTISANGTIHRFCIYTLNAVQIKFKVFRSDGTNYNVIHTSPSWISHTGGKKTYNVNWAVQSGDFVGFSNVESGYSIYMESGTGVFKVFSGDITTSVLISSGYDVNYAASLYANGFV